MSALFRGGPARLVLAAHALLAVALVAAGCGSTAIGGEQEPASLDPASPRIAAEGIAFDAAALAVPANRPFTLVFENREAVPHNVSIYSDAGRQDRRFEGVVFSGPATRWYPVPALAPGSYVFVCDVHPDMSGQLVAS
jgi:plastocyanin